MLRWLLLVGSLLISASGCDDIPTQLVVVVDSDIPTSDLGCLAVSANRPGSDEMAFHEFAIVEGDAAVGQGAFPFSFGVLPPGGDIGASVRVQLLGYPGPCLGAPVPGVSRVAQTGFLDCARLRLPVFLSQVCAGDPLGCAAMVPEQTCVPRCTGDTCQAQCAPVVIPVADLIEVDPGSELPDVAPDAMAPDGAAPDASIVDAATLDSDVDAGSCGGAMCGALERCQASRCECGPTIGSPGMAACPAGERCCFDLCWPVRQNCP